MADQDAEEGFLKDGKFTVRLRVRLLYVMAHVYTTADLASHRGFGVVPVRGNDQPCHFYGEGGGGTQDGGRGSWSPPQIVDTWFYNLSGWFVSPPVLLLGGRPCDPCPCVLVSRKIENWSIFFLGSGFDPLFFQPTLT